MLIGGLQKLSLLDYPGRPAAVIFTVGCNFHCGFCHNPELVKNNTEIQNQVYNEKEIFDFLKSRQGLLEGVVITGGEPTIQPDIVDFIKKIKEFGLLNSKPKDNLVFNSFTVAVEADEVGFAVST